MGQFSPPQNPPLNVRLGRLGTSNSFVADDAIGRAASVDVVEMEATAVSKVCFLTKTAFTAVKIVSDVEPVVFEAGQGVVTAAQRGELFEKFLATAIEMLGTACGRLVDGL